MQISLYRRNKIKCKMHHHMFHNNNCSDNINDPNSLMWSSY